MKCLARYKDTLFEVITVREVRKLFEDYQENIKAWKVYETRLIKDEAIKVKTICYEREKVDGGKIIKEDTKMAHRVDRLNSNSNAIKRIKADLRPFLLALGKVSSEQKEMLRSRHIKGSTLNDMAKEFDLSVSVIRNRLQHAEKRFYRLYQTFLEDETRAIM